MSRLPTSLLALSLLLASCSGEEGAPPATAPSPSGAGAAAPKRTLRLVEHGEGGVAAADLDRDGVDDLIYVHEAQIHAGIKALGPVEGLLQAVSRGDIDGDGDEEAVLGFGMGRGFQEAEAQVWAVHADRAEKLWSAAGPRAQIADLRVVDGRIFVARYVDERRVEGAWLAGGSLTVLGGAALGGAQIPLPGDDLLVGRMYGDDPRSDGDLQRLRGDAVLGTLPSLRGVRALASAELDGDAEVEVVVADGWHYQYGQRAEGHVALLDGPDLKQSRTIALLERSYTVNDIEVVRHDQPERRGLLLTGSRDVHLLRRDALGWADIRLESIAEGGNAVVAYLEDGPWALISGTPATLVPIDL